MDRSNKIEQVFNLFSETAKNNIEKNQKLIRMLGNSKILQNDLDRYSDKYFESMPKTIKEKKLINYDFLNTKEKFNMDDFSEQDNKFFSFNSILDSPNIGKLNKLNKIIASNVSFKILIQKLLILIAYLNLGNNF